MSGVGKNSAGVLSAGGYVRIPNNMVADWGLANSWQKARVAN